MEQTYIPCCPRRNKYNIMVVRVITDKMLVYSLLLGRLEGDHTHDSHMFNETIHT